LKRIGTPEDIASTALFLLQDSSAWMTGQIIGVDGGLGTVLVN
jgi:NAD(P)-dependent dehydrogenase (short-subunit alcohol dehydrogenase family)